MEMFESYAFIAVTCICLLITVLISVTKKNTIKFRGKKELKFLIYSLIGVFVFKELQYIFTFLYKNSIINNLFVESLFICFYYIVYPLPIIAVTYYLFACIDKKFKIYERIILLLPAFIMMVLSIISLFVPCLYSVSKEGDLIYGPLYFYLPLMSFGLMIFDIIFCVAYKEKLEKGCFQTFIPIFVAPFIALLFSYFLIFVLQRKNFSLIWIAMTLTLTIHYFTYILEIISTTDSLTDLANKQRLITYLNNILHSKKRDNIYGIMLDLDDFKAINDNYGHTIGDIALQDATKILIKSVPENTFISRFAGDEFVILISSKDINSIEEFENNLKQQEDYFNNLNNKSFYKIHFSYGYFEFKKDENYDVSTFLKIIDKNMYENKRSKKQNKFVKTL